MLLGVHERRESRRDLPACGLTQKAGQRAEVPIEALLVRRFSVEQVAYGNGKSSLVLTGDRFRLPQLSGRHEIGAAEHARDQVPKLLVLLTADQRIEGCGGELLLCLANHRIAVSRGAPPGALASNLDEPLGVLQTVGVRLPKFFDMVREGCTESCRSMGVRSSGQNPLQPPASSVLFCTRVLDPPHQLEETAGHGSFFAV